MKSAMFAVISLLALLPVHGWASPKLIAVAPGVHLVADSESEVFFIDGSYWSARGGAWHSAQEQDGEWTAVDRARVPVWLLEHPGRYYKNFRDEINEPLRNRKREKQNDRKTATW